MRFARLIGSLLSVCSLVGALLAAEPIAITANAPTEIALTPESPKAECTFATDGSQIVALRLATDSPDVQIALSFAAKAEFGDLKLDAGRSWTFEALSARSQLFDQLPQFPATWKTTVSLRNKKDSCRLTLQLEPQGAAPQLNWSGEPGTLLVRNAGQSRLRVEPDAGMRIKHPLLRGTSIAGDSTPEGDTLFRLPAGHWTLIGSGAGDVGELRSVLIPVSAGGCTVVDWPQMRAVEGEQSKGLEELTLRDASADGDTGTLLVAAPMFAEPPTPEAVRVLEGGQRGEVLSVEPIPAALHVVVLFDSSFSMRKIFGEAQAAALRFVENLPPESTVDFFDFDTKVRELPATDRAALLAAIREIKADGSTKLYDAIVKGLAKCEGHRRSAVVVFTDGFDARVDDVGHGSRATEEQVFEAVSKTQVPLFTIAYGEKPDEQTLQRLATDSGGAYFRAQADTVGGVFDQIAGLVDRDYRITYRRPAKVAASNTPFITFMIDVSGSMNDSPTATNPGRRLERAKDVLRPFINRLPAGSVVQLFTYSDKVNLIQAPTADRPRLLRALATADTGGGTATDKAIAASWASLEKVPTRNRSLVFVTDAALDIPAGPAGKAIEETLGKMHTADIRSLWVGMVPESGAAPFAKAAELAGGTHVVSPGVESLASALASLEKALASAEASPETAVEILIDKVAADGSHRLHGGAGLFALPPSGAVTESVVSGLVATVEQAPNSPDPTIVAKERRTKAEKTSTTKKKSTVASVAVDVPEDIELNRIAIGQTGSNEAVAITVDEIRFYSRLHGYTAPGSHRIVELAVTFKNVLPSQKVFIPEKGAAHPANWVGTGQVRGKTVVAVPPYLIPDLRRHLFLRWNDGVETPPSLLTTLDPEPFFLPDNASVQVNPGEPRTGRLVFLVEGDALRQASLHLYDTAYAHADIALVGPITPRPVPLADLPTRATGKLSDAFALNLLGHADTPDAVAGTAPGPGNVFRTIQLGLESNVQALLNLPPARSFELLVDTDKGPVATGLAPLTDALPGGLYRAPTLSPGAHNRFQQLYCLPAALAGSPAALFVEVKGEDVVLPLGAPLPIRISTTPVDPELGLGFAVNGFAMVGKADGLNRDYLAVDVTITDGPDGASTRVGNHFTLLKMTEPGAPYVDPEAPSQARKFSNTDNKAQAKGLGSVGASPELDTIRPKRPEAATAELLFGFPSKAVIPEATTRRGVLLFTPPKDGEWVLAFHGHELARLAAPAKPLAEADRWLVARAPQYPQLKDNTPEAKVAAMVAERSRTGWFKRLARAAEAPPVANPDGSIQPAELPPPALTAAGAAAWQQLLAADEAALWTTIDSLRLEPSSTAPWAPSLCPEAVLTQRAGTVADIAELARQWYAAHDIEVKTLQAPLSPEGTQQLRARIAFGDMPKALPILATPAGSRIVPFGISAEAGGGLFSASPTDAKLAPATASVVVEVFCRPKSQNAAAQMGNMASALGGGSQSTERAFRLWRGNVPHAELSRDAFDAFFFETGGSTGELRVQLVFGDRNETTKPGDGPKTAEWIPTREVITVRCAGQDPVIHERILDGAPLAGTCQSIAVLAPDLDESAARVLAAEWAKRKSADVPNHRSLARWVGRQKLARFLAAQTKWEHENAAPLGVALARSGAGRVLVATLAADADGKPRQSFDLARSTPQVFGEPAAANAFRAMHGLAETAFEGRVLGGFSVTDIWKHRGDYVGVTPKQRKAFAADLAAHGAPDALVERMKKGAEYLLFARRPLVVQGRPLWGWLEIDPKTYATRSVFSNGEHGMVETVIDEYVPEAGSYTLGFMVGVDASVWAVCAFTLEGLGYDDVLAKAEAFALGLSKHLNQISEEPSFSPEDGPLSIGAGGLDFKVGPVSISGEGASYDDGDGGFRSFSDGYNDGIAYYFARAKKAAGK